MRKTTDEHREAPRQQQDALWRLERALAAGAQALSNRMCRPQNRTNEEWLAAFAGNLTELIRAASGYLDTEAAPPALQVPSGVTRRPAPCVPGPRRPDHDAAVLVSP
jgi:hypothetical protein